MRVYNHFPNPDCKGYTILNVHGYHGSPKNSAYSALHEIGFENIISPSIDYDSEEPSNIIGTLNMLRVQYKADMIVGTNLGGFYAAVLSARHDLPVMLVNPCLTPFLLNILSDFKTRPLVKLFGELAKIDSANVSCLSEMMMRCSAITHLQRSCLAIHAFAESKAESIRALHSH